MSRNHSLKLKLDNSEFPPSPCVRVPFTVNVYLVDEKDQLVQGNIEYPLSVKLCYDEGANSATPKDDISPSALTMASVSISKNGTAKCTITLNELSMDHSNRKFVLLFSVAHDDAKTVFVKPVVSPSLLSVTYRLVIEEENREPFIWFKDEGGREKCIDLKVMLKDHNNHTVKNRKVKLKITLCYFGGAVVNAQDLLTLSSDSRLFIEELHANSNINNIHSAGETMIKYRINEVSKTHQSQPFCLLISPDTSYAPLCGDIAPAYSIPVEIRSKRNNPNKRPRENKASDDALDAIVTINNKAAKPLTNTVSIGSMNGSSVKKSKMNGSMSEITPQDEYVQVIDNVVKWTNRVVEGLQEIQWRPVGYQNADPTQLLYNFVNPNDVIKNLLCAYTADIHQQLLYLMNCNVSSHSNQYKMSDVQQSMLDSEVSQAPISRGISSFLQDDLFDGNGLNFHTTSLGRTHSLMLNPLSSSISYMNSASSLLQHTSSISSSTASVDVVSSTYVLAKSFYLGLQDLLSSSSLGSGLTSENRLTFTADKSQKTNQLFLGCPAYNSQGKLHGFYRDELDRETNSTVIKFTECVMSDGMSPSHNSQVIKLNAKEFQHLETILIAFIDKHPMKFKDTSLGKDLEYPILQLQDYPDFDTMIQNVMIQYWSQECSSSII